MLRIQGYAGLGHHAGHRLAGGTAGEDLLHDGGGSATNDGQRYDGNIRTAGYIGAAAQSAHHLAGGAGEDIYIEVRVHLQGRQNTEVQIVQEAALTEGIGVVGIVNLPDTGAVQNGLCRHSIEGLAAFQHPHKALVVHVHDDGGDAAQSKAGRDPPLLGPFRQILGAGNADGAGAGLEGIALLEESGRGDDVRHPLGDQQIPGILGQPGRTCADLGRVADLVHFHNIVYILLANTGRAAGIVHQGVGDDHHFSCIVCVNEGIAQAAAGVFADLTGAVTEFVGSGSSDEGHVDGQFSRFDGPGSGAVGPQDHRLVHDNGAIDETIAQFAANAAGFHPGDGAVLDVFRQGEIPQIHHRTGGKPQILNAQSADGCQNLAHNKVAFPEGMMEGDGHAVLQARGPDGSFQGRLQLGVPGTGKASHPAVYHTSLIGLGIFRACIGTNRIIAHLLGQFDTQRIPNHLTALPSGCPRLPPGQGQFLPGSPWACPPWSRPPPPRRCGSSRPLPAHQ